VLIIDLNCENDPAWQKRKSFNGIPFIWACLNSFGGRIGLTGKFGQSLENIKLARKEKNLMGIGVISEGTKFNPILYDFYFDMAWWNNFPQVNEWLSKYANYRYTK
jgi:hypothetical protein